MLAVAAFDDGARENRMPITVTHTASSADAVFAGVADELTVIVVDDGLATGSTMRAASVAVRAQEPDRLVVAVPVAAAQTCDELRQEVDEVVCPLTPDPFAAVGLWYEDFTPTEDEEVRRLLAAADTAVAR